MLKGISGVKLYGELLIPGWVALSVMVLVVGTHFGMGMNQNYLAACSKSRGRQCMRLTSRSLTALTVSCSNKLSGQSFSNGHRIMDSIALNDSKRNCCSFAFATVHKFEFLPRGGDSGGNIHKTFTHLSIPDILGVNNDDYGV